MLVPVTEICVKVERLDDLNKVMEKVKELEDANPNRIFNVSIEITV